jgi:hypothetical protein
LATIKKKALRAFFLFKAPSSESAPIFQAQGPDRINTELRQFMAEHPGSNGTACCSFQSERQGDPSRFDVHLEGLRQARPDMRLLQQGQLADLLGKF